MKLECISRWRSFYLEFDGGNDARASLIESCFLLRDQADLTGTSHSVFASPCPTLLFIFPDVGRPCIRLVPAQTERTPRTQTFTGWVFGFRFRGSISAVEDIESDSFFRAVQEELRQLADSASEPGQLEAGFAALSVTLSDRFSGDTLSNITGAARPKAKSKRSFRRHTQRRTGLTPKKLQVLRRFQMLLPQVAAGRTPLTELALSHAYSDQAHLSRDFVRRSGQSPGRLRRYWADREDVRFIQDWQRWPSLRFGLAVL